ncbi:hypothetical protein ACFL1I_04545 [Candidatus Omnitrophota bacterium]
MKKGLLMLAIAALAFSGVAEAAPSESVAITVSVVANLSVTLSSNTVALGAVSPGSTTVSSSAITATNDGSGLAEVFSLSHSTSGAWTTGAAPGAETYVLNAAFAADPAGATWTRVDSVVSGTVDNGGSEDLWFQFQAPTTTAATDSQSINVTVTAQLP